MEKPQRRNGKLFLAFSDQLLQSLQFAWVRLGIRLSIFQRPMSSFKYRRTSDQDVKKHNVWAESSDQSLTPQRMEPIGHLSMPSFTRWSAQILKRCIILQNVNNISLIRGIHSRLLPTYVNCATLRPRLMGLSTPLQSMTRNYCKLYSWVTRRWKRIKGMKILLSERTMPTALLLQTQVWNDQLVVQCPSFLVARECDTEKLGEARASDILSFQSGWESNNIIIPEWTFGTYLKAMLQMNSSAV